MNKNIKQLVESFIDDEPYIEDVSIHFNREQYIDLGLPSGTLWAKCNLGANCPEESGLYYQWGSTEGYSDGESIYSEYAYSIKHKNEYISTVLNKENDAAYVNSDGIATMPTKKQIEELIDNCEYRWTKLNGVIGAKFIGPSGQFIFFPSGGYFYGTHIRQHDNQLNVWASTCKLDDPKYAYQLICSEYSAKVVNINKCYGFSIRAVCKQK